MDTSSVLYHHEASFSAELEHAALRFYVVWSGPASRGGVVDAEVGVVGSIPTTDEGVGIKAELSTNSGWCGIDGPGAQSSVIADAEEADDYLAGIDMIAVQAVAGNVVR